MQQAYINTPPITPITNQSINSAAAVLHEIHKKEQIHWFWGLQTAEGFVDEKQTALDYCYRKHREYERTIRGKKRELDKLEALAKKQALTPEQVDEEEALQDEIIGYSRDTHRLSWQIRDAVMELQVAQKELERILHEHPEALDLSYEQLQQIYTPAALLERQVHYVAARIWAVENHLPETVGAAVFDIPNEQRQRLLEREIEVRTDLKISETSAHAMRVLASIPAHQRYEALMNAAHEVMNANQSIQQIGGADEQ